MFMSSRPLFWISFITLAVLFSFPNQVAAQTAASGGLVGAVTDPSDAVVSGAKVELRDNAKGTNQTKETELDGEYLFSFVAPGNYTLTVHPGFRTRRQALHVNPGPPSTLNVRLELEGSSTTLQVTAEALLLQAEDGDASSAVNRLQVEQLPNPGNDLTSYGQKTRTA